eukprot:gene9489-6659_t
MLLFTKEDPSNMSQRVYMYIYIYIFVEYAFFLMPSNSLCRFVDTFNYGRNVGRGRERESKEGSKRPEQQGTSQRGQWEIETEQNDRVEEFEREIQNKTIQPHNSNQRKENRYRAAPEKDEQTSLKEVCTNIYSSPLYIPAYICICGLGFRLYACMPVIWVNDSAVSVKYYTCVCVEEDGEGMVYVFYSLFFMETALRYNCDEAQVDLPPLRRDEKAQP